MHADRTKAFRGFVLRFSGIESFHYILGIMAGLVVSVTTSGRFQCLVLQTLGNLGFIVLFFIYLQSRGTWTLLLM